MNRTTLILNGVMLVLGFGFGAVPQTGAAPSLATNQNRRARGTRAVLTVPAPFAFSLDRRRGLLTQGWINGEGPFSIAIDTGAGLTIVSESTAKRLQLKFTEGPLTVLAGISGNEITAPQVTLSSVALGNISNSLPGPINAAVVETLPDGVDIVLDPTQAFSPLGYTIDLPAERLTAFDAQNDGLNLYRSPANGTTVPWIRNGQDRRPFVLLGDGTIALVDTGSSFGLAISSGQRSGTNRRAESARDLGGGTFRSDRIAPSTISIGSLVLNGIPTDMLFGTDDTAPSLLGRDALKPFIISFDPLHRLIQIAPSVQDLYRSR